MKQVQSLASREEAMANFGSRQASWRILRKIYALRVEFEQAGSLGECNYIRNLEYCKERV